MVIICGKAVVDIFIYIHTQYIHVSNQIITWCTLNLHNVICQLISVKLEEINCHI